MDDIACRPGSFERIGIHEQGIERLGMIMQVLELRNELARSRGMHACAK